MDRETFLSTVDGVVEEHSRPLTAACPRLQDRRAACQGMYVSAKSSPPSLPRWTEHWAVARLRVWDLWHCLPWFIR